MSAETPPTDKQIRIAIATIIRNALNSLYNPGLAIPVWDHWILKQDLGESAAALRIKSGVDKGKIHGWMIGLSGINRKRPDAEVNKMGAARLKTIGINRRDIARSYRIWCAIQLNTGDANNESETNSENVLADEIEKVSDAFSSNPMLGISNSLLQGHSELQFEPIDTFNFDGTMANVAQGTLTVFVHRTIS